MNKKNLLFFSCILLFATILYTYNLSSLPKGFHGDEGETALQAAQMLHNNELSIIGVGWYDVPLLSFVPHAVTMAIFGESIMGVRLGSVIFGLGTLPFIYLLTLLLFTRRIALITTLLFATSHLWLALSRVGIPYAQSAFLAVGCFYFLFKGFKDNHKYNFVAAGVFLGLSPYFYFSARAIPLIIFPILLLRLFKSKNVGRELMHASLIFLTALILFLPQGLFYLNHPNTFSSRSKAVFIFSDSGRAWSSYEYKERNDVEILISQTFKSINIFTGDNSTQYGYKGQLLDTGSLVLFLLGLIYIVKQKKIVCIFLIWWFGVTLFVGQVLTTIPSPIFLPRFVVGLPVIFIFMALGVEMIYQKLPKKYSHLIIALMLLIITWSNLYTYFYAYPSQQARGLTSGPHGISPRTIANFINTLPASYSIVFLSRPFIDGNHGAIRFITRGHEYIAPIDPKSYVPDSTKVTYPTAYIVYPEYEKVLEKIKTTYPSGKLTTVLNADHKIDYYTFTTISLP